MSKYVPKSRTISLTMYLSIPLLCSGWRKDRNSCSFSSWSAGVLSAWNQRSFRLSKTSWAVRWREENLNELFCYFNPQHITLLVTSWLILIQLYTYSPHPASGPHYSLFSQQSLSHWTLCWPEIWLCIRPTSHGLWTKHGLIIWQHSKHLLV